METRELLKWSIVVAAIIGFQYAVATETENQSSTVQQASSAQQDATPDYLAYLALVAKLKDTESEGGRADNIARIQKNLLLDPAHARAFLDFALSSYEEMEKTNRTITHRMLCAGGKPKYETDKTYAVLDVLDDIKEANLRKTYKRVRIRLSSEATHQLNQWLTAIKANHQQNLHEDFRHTNRPVEQIVSSACDLLAAY